MKFEKLETVVLARDLPQHGLKRGDLGAVVQVFEADRLEVEFVAVSGKAKALLTLCVGDVRKVRDTDLVTVRSAGTLA